MLGNLPLFWPNIHHPGFGAKLVNFSDDVFGVALFAVFEDKLEQIYLSFWDESTPLCFSRLGRSRSPEILTLNKVLCHDF